MIARNKKIILIISIIFTVVLALSFSYAFFYYSREGNTMTLNSGSISINFEEETNYMTLHDTYPKSDAMGKIDPYYYDFTVTGSKGTNDDVLYEIQIVETDGNTLDEEYVKVYLTNQEDVVRKGVSSLNELPTSEYNGNRVVYSNYIYDYEQSQDFRLRVWVDASYTENVQNTFNFQVILYAVNVKFEPILYDIIEKRLMSYLLEDDGDARILSGGGGNNGGSPVADDNFKNYVWYSGKLWRIVALNNDGSIKLVTHEDVTAISWGENVAYEGSWMYQWLNEDFKDTLYNYEELLVTDYRWNATQMSDGTKPAETTIIEGTVGLLNYYEYVRSYSNLGTDSSAYKAGYLNNGYYWWLITPYSSSNLWGVSYQGDAITTYGNLSSNSYSVRPSINLKSNIQISGGDGSKTNPYTIIGDINEPAENELISERVSGEYVTFDNELYRIVNIENDITKITKADYIRDSTGQIITFFPNFNDEDYTQSDYYWKYYVNNTWYNDISEDYKNMLVSGIWYLGTVSVDDENVSSNYKNSICATSNTTETTKECTRTSTVYNGYVGIGRIGEMFTSQIGEGYNASDGIWTITPSSAYQMRVVDFFGDACYDNGQGVFLYGVRPSIFLKSTIKITGGQGTKESPFEISE